MDLHDLMRSLQTPNNSKIVMLVADGLGGLAMEPGGKTELETAHTPNLDRLAQRGVQGGSIPVKPGISPGSGPGHLALFGYDPLRFLIGRGALEATGIGLQLQPGDVAARCNFCTLDAERRVIDRRAGRIPTAESAPLAESLNQIRIAGVDLQVVPVKEHRFVVVFRGTGLGDRVSDTDPLNAGKQPLKPHGADSASQRTAEFAEQFVHEAERILAGHPRANGLTMRGFAGRPQLPSYHELFGLRAAAIAVYPMYKGLASLAGMEVLGKPDTLAQEVALMRDHWQRFDFFFLHYKYTDSTGEDGNFAEKVKRIEEFDAVLPEVEELQPDVLIVTGDHSTPSFLRSHSWHPVPTLLVSNCCRGDGLTAFNESTCIRGGLGLFEGQYLMSLAMANAGRLAKYGA
jgi:2,3-bisphosphoglycerate-independent phosphoglycerate mutase